MKYLWPFHVCNEVIMEKNATEMLLTRADKNSSYYSSIVVYLASITQIATTYIDP